jgi:hypothetical protein
MFAKFAKVRTFGTRRDAPGCGRPAYSNDNHPSARHSQAPPGSQRRMLVCRWRLAAESGRLECQWEVEPADAHGRLASQCPAISGGSAGAGGER